MTLFIMLFISFSVSAAMDPELLAMVGNYRLSSGDDSCAKVAHVEKARSDETLTVKDTSRGTDLSIFPDVDRGFITYSQQWRVMKQRNTFFEKGLLLKQFRQCRGIITTTCYGWVTMASFKIISRQSFELAYDQKTCTYEEI